jgi:nucleoside-diphosphate-sugar epimerase
MSDKVLVTGATGFIAQHCIVQLLDSGYRVRGTARGDGRTAEVAGVLEPHLTLGARERLGGDFEVVAADLTSDENWRSAVEGCRFVLHVASPLPSAPPKDAQDLIVPARDGALRVLRAASEGGVERVVMTSSMAAICYGRERDHVFTEVDWSNVDGPRIGAYEQSKTIAERAAWEFMASLGAQNTMDLVTINPGLVLGPLLCAEWSTSAELVKKILQRSVPAIPDARFTMVDVRDVAASHVAAMLTPEASGQRFICCIESHAIREVAMILKDEFEPQGFKVPTRSLPLPALRIVALWDRQARLLMADVGRPAELDNSKIRRVLGIEFRDLREMTVSMAESMIRYGIVKAKRDRSVVPLPSLSPRDQDL